MGIPQDEPMRFPRSFTGVSVRGNFYPSKHFQVVFTVSGRCRKNDHKLRKRKYQQLTKLKDRHCKKNKTHTHTHNH